MCVRVCDAAGAMDCDLFAYTHAYASFSLRVCSLSRAAMAGTGASSAAAQACSPSMQPGAAQHPPWSTAPTLCFEDERQPPLHEHWKGVHIQEVTFTERALCLTPGNSFTP